MTSDSPLTGTQATGRWLHIEFRLKRRSPRTYAHVRGIGPRPPCWLPELCCNCTQPDETRRKPYLHEASLCRPEVGDGEVPFDERGHRRQEDLGELAHEQVDALQGRGELRPELVTARFTAR